jgi:hypothetical protein
LDAPRRLRPASRHGHRLLRGIPYTPRGSAPALFRQSYRIGRGKVDVRGKHRCVLCAHSLAPSALVVSLVLLGVASLCSHPARCVLAGEATMCVGSALAFAARSLRTHNEEWSLLPMVVDALCTIRAAYGAGMLHGAPERAIRSRGRFA